MLLRVAQHAATMGMIKSFRHKGLRRFFDTGHTAGIQASHAKRLRMQLAALDTAVTIDDMDLPGFRLHPLKGDQKGRWAISVNGNWRVTFEFVDGNAYIIDYEDYH
jgi:proteic killer suppression protein